MGNITIQGDLTGDVPGGEVGGASNLTTVGAIPYVSASGVLNQDPTALFWDAANNYLYAGGYTSPSNYSVRLGPANGEIFIRSGNGIISHSGANMAIGSTTSMSFNANNVEVARFATTTGNLLIGTTTDSNFKLDVAASGSAGTARFYGGSGVSNSTKVVVQAGGGQSTTNLTEWQDSSGAVLASVDSNAGFSIPTAIYASTWWRLTPGSSGNTGFEFGATNRLTWSNTTANYSGTKDIGITRNAAGVLEINNGTAGTYRDLILRRSQHNGVTVADLPAAAAGNAGSIQYVTDANATTIGSTVAGGGANKVMVWSDGAAWKIFAS